MGTEGRERPPGRLQAAAACPMGAPALPGTAERCLCHNLGIWGLRKTMTFINQKLPAKGQDEPKAGGPLLHSELSVYLQTHVFFAGEEERRNLPHLTDVRFFAQVVLFNPYKNPGDRQAFFPLTGK